MKFRKTLEEKILILLRLNLHCVQKTVALFLNVPTFANAAVTPRINNHI